MKTEFEEWDIGVGGGGGIQYSNIVRNIGGKHPNTMSKIDKIPTSTSHCACLFISSMYAAEINLSYCEKM